MLQRIALCVLGLLALAPAAWGQPPFRPERVEGPSFGGALRPGGQEVVVQGPAFRFCGGPGQTCCEPYRGSGGGVIGPSHCNEGLGCNVATDKCERPCGQSGQVCCDGPDTVAPQGGPFRLGASGNFVLRLPMCQSSACDLTTRRCVADCGRSAGEACCGPQPSLAVASCLDPSLACNFSDTSLERGTCATCGGLGQISCARFDRCGEGLEEDANGLCACNEFQSNHNPVTSTTQCTRWPGRRALCFEIDGSLRQLHTVSGPEIRPALDPASVCVEGAFQVRDDGTVLVDVDNPRIWDGALVTGTERTGEGAFYQAFDPIAAVFGGDGGASADAELSRIPAVPGRFGLDGSTVRISMITPGVRLGHAPVSLDVRDVRSRQAPAVAASLRLALNPDVLLVPVQVFTLVSGASPGAALTLPPAAAAALFDRVPDSPGKQVIADGDGRVTSVMVPLNHLVLNGDARPASLGRHTLPDDLWAQCGIQFRLVRYTALQVPDALTAPRGHSTLQGALLEILQAVRDSGVHLDGPLTVMVAPWCADVNQAQSGSFEPPSGQALIAQNAACIRASHASGTDLAHELGHILIGKAGHPDCTRPEAGDNLMCSPNGGPELTREQCAEARKRLLSNPGRLAFPPV